MAHNDTVLLDGIIEKRKNDNYPSNNVGEIFEYLICEQILKEHDLDDEQIKQGIIDGKDDGGIDAFYVFVNGHFVQDLYNFSFPRGTCELLIYILTSKHRNKFEQKVLDNQVATISEILDLQKTEDELIGSYSELLLEKRRELFVVYRSIAAKLRSTEIRYYYASRGSFVGENTRSRANQIIEITQSYFSDCLCEYSFFGSKEILMLYRKIKDYSLRLPYSKALAKEGQCFIVLSRISDYNSFITSDDKKLRMYLFDSNVRDYMGLNSTNDDILCSLNHKNNIDFWWLNNGITILASGARDLGGYVEIDNVQIVNGLQTSQTIYNYFHSCKEQSDERCVMIKIISADKLEIRDNIIRATNNQTSISTASLHATDKIQRDIEEILLKAGFHYERRLNYYKNQGVNQDLIITPLNLSKIYVALISKSLSTAIRLRSRFMRKPESYARVYNENISITVWASLVKIYSRVSIVLKSLRKIDSNSSGRYHKGIKLIVMFLCVARIKGTYSYTNDEIINFDANLIADDLVIETWEYLFKEYSNKDLKRVWSNADTISNILESASKNFGIKNFEEANKRDEAYFPLDIKGRKILDINLINKIDKLLPKQPWPKGTHHNVAKSLNISSTDVSHAINYLIDNQKRYPQKDGVVFDFDGSIIKNF